MEEPGVIAKYGTDGYFHVYIKIPAAMPWFKQHGVRFRTKKEAEEEASRIGFLIDLRQPKE